MSTSPITPCGLSEYTSVMPSAVELIISAELSDVGSALFKNVGKLAIRLKVSAFAVAAEREIIEITMDALKYIWSLSLELN